jgi:hypothetical protein
MTHIMAPPPKFAGKVLHLFTKQLAHHARCDVCGYTFTISYKCRDAPGIKVHLIPYSHEGLNSRHKLVDYSCQALSMTYRVSACSLYRTCCDELKVVNFHLLYVSHGTVPTGG